MMQVILDIDISKDTFDVVLISNDKQLHQQFENNPCGFKLLKDWLQENKATSLHARIGAIGQYREEVAENLYPTGYWVSIVHPIRIKAYTISKLRRNKTDKADAELITEYCLREEPVLWISPPASFKDLQVLKRQFKDLQSN